MKGRILLISSMIFVLFIASCIKQDGVQPGAQNSATASVTTSDVSSITINSAVVGGNVTSEGGSPVTVRGIRFGTNTKTLLQNGRDITVGSGAGSFSTTVTGLSKDSLYYVCAYASNTGGIVYGGQKYFTPR